MVPRSFIGPLIVAAFSAPFSHLAAVFEFNKFASQLIGKKLFETCNF